MKLNPNIEETHEPPIPEAAAWLDLPRRDPDLEILNLSQAVPDYPPPQGLRDALVQAVQDPQTAFYTPILGLEALRQEFAASLSKRYGGDLRGEDVAITAGANHAFCMAVLAIAEPGAEIIIPQPHYFNHDMWCSMQGLRPVHLPCRMTGNGILPTPEDAAKRISDKTRAILLVSPNNPTGSVYPADLVAAFFSLARQHHIALIMDETYRDFLPEKAPHELFRNPDWREGFVHLYSFSKTYSLTGYRVGGMAAGPKLMQAIKKVSDTLTICPSHIGQLAALYGIRELGSWVAGKRGEMEARIAMLDHVMKGNPGGYRLVSRGAFFAYIEHPFPGKTASEAARRLLREHSVFTLPGSMFGKGQERYLRAAFANIGPRQIHELGQRLAGSSCPG